MNLIKQLAIFAYRVWPITLIVVLGLSAVVIGPQAKVADPVPDMSREAQCSRGDTYVWGIEYGSTREVAWSDCKTRQLIKVKKM